MTEENSSGADNLESKLTEVMSAHPNGVSAELLMKFIPSMTKKQFVVIVNKWSAQGKIDLLTKGKGNELVYKLSSSRSAKNKGSDVEERIILQALEKAGNNGATSKDLKFEVNLPQPRITKILKALESKRLVKSITSSSKKKLFMLYDVEPSETITGGIFFSGQEFESEFVDVLGKECYRYLLQTRSIAEKQSDPIAQKNASFKSSKDICNYINGLKISKVNLALKDIEAILESLIYDGKLEKDVLLSNNNSSNSSKNLYRVTKPLVMNAGLMRIPCGVCQVYKDCHVGGSVSPATCVYMREWLEY